MPNHVTLLSQLRFHTYHNQMYGVRRTITEIRDGGFILDIHEVNSIIWAFARNEHLEVAEAIYRVLRNNAYVNGSDDGTFDGADEDIAATVKFLDEMENIVIPPTVVPDRTTYTTLVQSYAYRGDLTRSLQILKDMLSSPDPLATWKGEAGATVRFPPTMQIYRALFLGFYRHGVGPKERAASHPGRHGPRGIDRPGLDWDLHNLHALYKRFLEQPADQRPGERTVYWLIMAFEKCSGGDYWRMRKVWMALERKWGRRWCRWLCGVRSRIYDNTKHPDTPS
jgi:pentatricopeptide repeat protein